MRKDTLKPKNQNFQLIHDNQMSTENFGVRGKSQ